MGATKAKWRNNQLAFYDSGTYETVRPLANMYLMDDFFGTTLNTDIWTGLDLNNATLNNPVQSYINASIGAVNENAAAGVYGKDDKPWDIDKGWIFECRLRPAVAPSGTAEIQILMINDSYGAGSMSVAEADEIDKHVGFVLDGSLSILAYSDDGTTDNNAVDTGVDAVAASYNIYRIDATNAADVKLYVDGVQVCETTTFNMSTGANVLFQPWIVVYKAADAATNATGTFRLDYVRIWQPTR